MNSQITNNILLVGNDITSDEIIQNNLLHNGCFVDYISTEQDLITEVHNKNRKTDLIIISNIHNKTDISENVLNKINVPLLVLNTSSERDSFLINIQENVKTVINLFNDEKEQTKEKNLIEDRLDAYALHEIICDEKGNAIDYRFLDADKYFLKRLNKTKEELIGKTALELFPRIEKIWIETFGRVALSGKPENLLHYSIEFDNYYEARIYSPEKYKFLVLFIDMKQVKGHMYVSDKSNKT